MPARSPTLRPPAFRLRAKICGLFIAASCHVAAASSHNSSLSLPKLVTSDTRVSLPGPFRVSSSPPPASASSDYVTKGYPIHIVSLGLLDSAKGPRKIIWMTPGVSGPSWSIERTTVVEKLAQGALIKDIPAHNMQSELLQSMADSVGGVTFDEAIVDSHGDRLLLAGKHEASSHKDKASTVDLIPFLHEQERLQSRLHMQTTKRWLFLGCEVLTNLGADSVAELRHMAKVLGTEIVGATTIRWGNAVEEARFARFSPDGSVTLDPISASPKLLKLNMRAYRIERRHGARDHPRLIENSDTWFFCHANQTQEVGARCQDDISRRNMQWAEQHPRGGDHVTSRSLISLSAHLQLSAFGAQQWAQFYTTLSSKNILSRLSVGRTPSVQPRDIGSVQATIERAYTDAAALYDTLAVRAHESFIRTLSPEGRAFMLELFDRFEEEHAVRLAAFPPRPASLASTTAKATSFFASSDLRRGPR